MSAKTLPSFYSPRPEMVSQDWGGRYDVGYEESYGKMDLSSLRQKIPHRISPRSRTPPPSVALPGSPGYKVGDGVLHKLIQAQLFIEQAVSENTSLRDYVSLLRAMNRWRLDMHAGFFRRYQMRNARSIWLRSTLGVYFNVMKARTVRWLHLRSCAEKVIVRAQRICEWPVFKSWSSIILDRKRAEETIVRRKLERRKMRFFAGWKGLSVSGPSATPLLIKAVRRVERVKLWMSWNKWRAEMMEMTNFVKIASKIMWRWNNMQTKTAMVSWKVFVAEERRVMLGVKRMWDNQARRLMLVAWYGMGHVELELASDDERELVRRGKTGRGGLLLRAFRGWLGIALEEATLKSAALKVVLRGERGCVTEGFRKWAEVVERDKWWGRVGAVVRTRREATLKRRAMKEWSWFSEQMARKSLNVQWWESRFAVITKRWEQGWCRSSLRDWARLTRYRHKVTGIISNRVAKIRAKTLQLLVSFWSAYARRRALMRGKEAAMLEVREREASLYTLTEWRREAGGSGLRKASAFKIILKRERTRGRTVWVGWAYLTKLRHRTTHLLTRVIGSQVRRALQDAIDLWAHISSGSRASKRFNNKRLLKSTVRAWASTWNADIHCGCVAFWISSLHRMATFLYTRGQAEALRRAWGALVAGVKAKILRQTVKGRLTHRVWKMTEEWVRRRALQIIRAWAHAGVQAYDGDQRLMEGRACAFMAGRHRSLRKAEAFPVWKRYVKIRRRYRETEKNVTERWLAIMQCRAIRRWEEAVRGKRPRIQAMRKMAGGLGANVTAGDTSLSESRSSMNSDSSEEREKGRGSAEPLWGRDSEPLSL